ncbi:MAG: crossover junction endodeoxyribonuclease RuvC [Nitrospirota bacterium]|nr:crossover junction endodeoxyribonuclease RuvC [Nitrospirota bacterium]
MIVLGVDPGTVATGYGVVQRIGSRLICLEAGEVRSSPRLPMPERLLAIHDRIRDLLQRHSPQSVAVETAFISKLKSPQTAIKLGQARGVILLACARAGVPVADVNPVTAKQSVAGYGRADKEQVMFMIQRLLGLTSPPSSEHSADALALALAHLQTSRLTALTATTAGKTTVMRKPA